MDIQNIDIDITMSTFDITLDCLSEETLSFLRSKFKVNNKLELAQLINAKIFGKDSTNIVFCTIQLDGSPPPKVIDTEPITEDVKKGKIVQKTMENNLIAPIHNFELSYYGNALFVTPRDNNAEYIGCNWDNVDSSFEVDTIYGGWWKSTLSGWLFRSASKEYLDFIFDKSDIKQYQLEHYGQGLLLIPPYNFTLNEKDEYKNWSHYDKKFSVDNENGGWWKPFGSLVQKNIHGWFFKINNQKYLEDMVDVKLPFKKEQISSPKKVTGTLEVPTTPEITASVFTPPAPKKEVKAILQDDLTIEDVLVKFGNIMPYGIGFIVSFPSEIFETYAKKNVITLTNKSGKEFNGIKHSEKNGYFFEEEAKECVI